MEKVKSLEDLVKKPLANSRRGVCYRITKDNILSDYDFSDYPAIQNSNDMYNFIIEQLTLLDLKDRISVQEVAGFVCFNNAMKPIGFFAPFTGGIASTIMDIEVIVFSAISLLSRSVVVFHSHPSGNPRPSDADYIVTSKLTTALSYFDITLADHMILTPNNSGQKFSNAVR